MKVVIAGSVKINDYQLVVDAVRKSGFEITEVVSGGARGVDRLGEQYAVNNGLPSKVFKADWARHKQGAGPRRNRLMAEYADAVIVIWNGKSRGSASMTEEAKRSGKKLYTHLVDY